MIRVLVVAMAMMPVLGAVALAGPAAPPETAVPESATLGLLAVGAGALLMVRLRK